MTLPHLTYRCCLPEAYGGSNMESHMFFFIHSFLRGDSVITLSLSLCDEASRDRIYLLWHYIFSSSQRLTLYNSITAWMCQFGLDPLPTVTVGRTILTLCPFCLGSHHDRNVRDSPTLLRDMPATISTCCSQEKRHLLLKVPLCRLLIVDLGRYEVWTGSPLLFLNQL